MQVLDPRICDQLQDTLELMSPFVLRLSHEAYKDGAGCPGKTCTRLKEEALDRKL